MNTKKLALFFQPGSPFRLYFPKKLIAFLLINRYLRNLNQYYRATSLIFIVKPEAS
ncbi:hypothetical protein MAMP_00631 [Methylophaga aminisulfidivorans MP]|uniref:Uncharacterized protein n=1 Tax=Methylophaga aminisulfidivorans MP TaxID=1026882 RepID=F5T1T5_9GAMM|nr:hypothetical protein MAMP_00631 [Methylophaga aminisulfidivorans MP]